MAKLTRYRAKRDFTRTAEPAGDVAIAPAAHPRFVIQKHAARRLHYDLRLEVDGVFKSWAVTRGPSLDPADKRLAVEVEDHPLAYGDFEGTIPQGEYGGGTVMVWDRGFWRPADGADPAKALADGELKLVLAGEKLVGGFVLVRLARDRERTRSGQAPRANWLLIKHRDGHEQAGGILPDDDRSVASGRSMAEIAAGAPPGPRPFVGAGADRAASTAVWSSKLGGPIGTSGAAGASGAGAAPAEAKLDARTPPAFLPPQLCRTVARPPAGAGWVHEIKLDGYRMQLRVAGHQATMRTRNGLDWTERFQVIADAARVLPDCIVDGEVVRLDDDGVPDFAGLQAELSAGRSDGLVYFAFDLLFKAGRACTAEPLERRKEALAALLAGTGLGAAASPIRYLPHFDTAGDALLKSACLQRLEGIVSKRITRPYAAGRGDDWTKAKCRGGEEVVIAGWSGDRRTLRSLVVGVHRDGRLVPVGRVGTGFSAETARALLARLRPLATERNPFEGPGAPKRGRDVTWVVPRLVAEIELAGWTGAGAVRQASFKGLRDDKPASEVIAEEIAAPAADGAADPVKSGGTAKAVSRSAGLGPPSTAASSRGTSRSTGHVVAGIVVSNPAKVLWPAANDAAPVTKLDLCRYYEAIGDRLLAHIGGRPCSLVRAPDGIGAGQFFQRHAMAGMSSLFELVKVTGDRKPYVAIDRPEALVAAGQIAAVELHPWNCAPNAPEVPGRLVFDLDPAPDVAFADVIRAAKELKARLEVLGLVPFCKTTGGKGLHVVVPLAVARAADRATWPQAKGFAQAVSAAMAADSPDRYLTKMSKALRAGRVFLDYLRNDRTATAVAAFSPRARPGAPVAMPIDWTVVSARLDPARFTLATAVSQANRRPAWAGYDKAARPLTEAIRRLVGKGR